MKAILRIGSIFALIAFSLLLSPSLNAATPLPILTGSYKLPATLDPTVSTILKTELWAEIQRPATGGPYPLIVFLHGNHGTCGRFDASLGIRIDDAVDYTFSGTCPSGYVVTPNHLGYRYLAAPLARSGYVVVSINANRGVTAAGGEVGDSGLNLRRGRLVLRHLQQLAAWNLSGGEPSSLGFSLQGLIDFTKVGLMGHSRGGEGMRAAIAQYNDAGSPWPSRIGTPVNFRAVFEIGPVDGQTSRILNAPNVNWNVILPGCDGDVSDLQGIKPFDRMLKSLNETTVNQKSSFQVFGANHNFYNTQWQESDAFSCLGQTPIFPQTLGSASQRVTASQTLVPFFQAHLSTPTQPVLTRRFDPSFPLPVALTSITQYARGFTPGLSPGDNFVIDDFNKATGISSNNVPNQSFGLTAYQHGSASFTQDPSQRAALVSWNSLSGSLNINATASGIGADVRAYRALEFRVMLRCFGSLCNQPPKPAGDVDFSIALTNGNGTVSAPIALKSRAVVRRPAGSFSNNEIFQTVRIPLTAFAGVNLSNFHGVVFTFDKQAPSSIYLGNIRLTKQPAANTILPTGAVTAQTSQMADQIRAISAASNINDVNQIAAIRKIAPQLGNSQGRAGTSAVEIELVTSRRFPISNALPVLSIGERNFTVSRFASTTTERLVFTLDEAEFANLTDAVPVSVRVGGAPIWHFGALQKSALRTVGAK